MALIVQKFGGSSVANAERVMNVAKIVTDTYKEGNDVVVVVSAQGDTTDDLIEKASAYIEQDKDLQMIKNTYSYAYEKHKGQFRKSGEEYTTDNLYFNFLSKPILYNNIRNSELNEW